MRRLALYWMQLWCDHEFEYEEKYAEHKKSKGIRISCICRHCSYHRSFWKFL